MGDMYNYESNINVTGGDGGDNHRSSPDDISVFLRQIMSRSSSSTSASSSSSFVGPQAQGRTLPVASVPEDPVPGSSCLPMKDVVSRGDYGYFSGNAVRGNVSSSSVGGGSGNETDEHEYDCESEEALEVLLDEVPTKPAVPRSSKRSRAAEVHNLSEKRRRSRINEKMKALQNLIPNSNKTDKASMLDEAIDYLKQLQLQVQMLSMRNGINLHPMCLPGLLQPSHVSRLAPGIAEDHGPLHMNMTGSFPLNAETPASTMFGLPNHCTSALQSLSSNTPHEFNSEAPSGPESSIKPHFVPFPLYSSCEENHGEDFLPYQQLNVSHSERHPSELASLPFGRRASNIKDSNCMEACITGINQAGGMLLKSNDHNAVLSPDLNSIQNGRSALIGGVKTERRGI